MPAADVPPLPTTGEDSQSRSVQETSWSRRQKSPVEVPDAELERLLALRSNNRDARLQRERRDADRLQHNHELAAAWKRRVEAKALQLKQSRQEQLQRDCFKSSRRLDDASLMSMEPRAELTSSSPASPRTTTQEMAVPAGGRSGRKSLTSSDLEVQHMGNIEMPPLEAAFQRQSSVKSAKSFRRSPSPHSSSVPAPLALESPRHSHALPAEALATRRNSVSGALPAASAPCTPRHREATGPEVSLMPRKEMLRQRQQELLKTKTVVFYKPEMRAHFEKIQEAVEFTFIDSTRNGRPNMSLAKPVISKETRNAAFYDNRSSPRTASNNDRGSHGRTHPLHPQAKMRSSGSTR